MSATDVLKRCARAGVHLEVSGDKVVAEPTGNLTDDLRVAIREHKPDLLALLQWNDDDAFSLIRKCLAYCAELYDGGPLDTLRVSGDAVDMAFRAEDMFLLRVACRSYAQAAVSLFKSRRKAA